MKSLFTIFELLPLIGGSLGIAVGCIGGYHLFGPVGLAVGAILGLLLGIRLGNVPGNRSIVAVHRELMGKSDDDLREDLHRPDCKYPNFILLELDYRGADISSELPAVLDMLESPDLRRRRNGVAAITSAFPVMASKVPDYRPTDTVDECKRKVRVLRSLAEQPAAADGEDAAAEP